MPIAFGFLAYKRLEKSEPPEVFDGYGSDRDPSGNQYTKGSYDSYIDFLNVTILKDAFEFKAGETYKNVTFYQLEGLLEFFKRRCDIDDSCRDKEQNRKIIKVAEINLYDCASE